MSWISQRLDRLRSLVAECIQKGFTPSKVGFADFIIHKCASLGLSPLTTKGYITTLVEAYHYDGWVSYVKNNDYLTAEEKERWFEKHGYTRTAEINFKQASDSGQ